MSFNCIMAAFSPENVRRNRQRNIERKKRKLRNLLEHVLSGLSLPAHKSSQHRESHIRQQFRQAQQLYDELDVYDRMDPYFKQDHKTILHETYLLMYNEEYPQCIKAEYAKKLLQELRHVRN